MSRQSDLSRRVSHDLAARSLNGTWAQPCSLLIILVSTDCVRKLPSPTWSGTALLAALTVVRLILLRYFDALYSRSPRLWGRSVVGLHLFSAAFWGAAACLATVYLTVQDRSTLIILLAHASMGLGMVNLLVHNPRHMNVALAVLYGPLLFVEVRFVDGWWHGPALITLAYLVYLILQGRKLSMAYWQQVTDNYDLAVIARRDFLTHLPNRLGMEEALDHAVNTARQGGRLMALLYIDLDGFKEVNDRYSHRAGDLLLREVARRLSSGVAPAGVAARLGGDEFAVLVADCPPQETASRIADPILQATKAPVLIDGHAVVCSASVGVSFFPDDADTADHLVRAADRAMYIAKNSGKDRVCILQNLPTGDIFASA